MAQPSENPSEAELESILDELSEKRNRAMRGRPKVQAAKGSDPPLVQPGGRAKGVSTGRVVSYPNSVKYSDPEPSPLARSGEWQPWKVRVTPKGIVALALGACVTFLWVRFLAGMASAPVAPGDPARIEADARRGLVLTRERIDYFRLKHGRTPVDIREVGHTGAELIGYERISEGQYRLTAPSPSGPIVFDSMRPDVHAEVRGDVRGSAVRRP